MQLPLTPHSQSLSLQSGALSNTNKAENIGVENEFGEDDEEDADYEESEDNNIVVSKYPAKAAPQSVPFEPYHMALTETKVVLTWWKSQKRRVVVQVKWSTCD